MFWKARLKNITCPKNTLLSCETSTNQHVSCQENFSLSIHCMLLWIDAKKCLEFWVQKGYIHVLSMGRGKDNIWWNHLTPGLQQTSVCAVFSCLELVFCFMDYWVSHTLQCVSTEIQSWHKAAPWPGIRFSWLSSFMTCRSHPVLIFQTHMKIYISTVRQGSSRSLFQHCMMFFFSLWEHASGKSNNLRSDCFNLTVFGLQHHKADDW